MKKSKRKPRPEVPSLVSLIRRPMSTRLMEGWRMMNGGTD